MNLLHNLTDILTLTTFSSGWSLANGRLALLLVPFVPSRITYINLVKVSVAGGLVEGATLFALAYGLRIVCAGLHAVWGGTVRRKLERKCARFFSTAAQGGGNFYVSALLAMCTGPIGLAIMRRAGVQDSKRPTMLYLALMGLAGSVIVNVITDPFLNGAIDGDTDSVVKRNSRANVPPRLNPTRRRTRRDMRPQLVVRGDGQVYTYLPLRCPQHTSCDCELGVTLRS